MFLGIVGKITGIALLGGAIIGTPILVTNKSKTQENPSITHQKVTNQHCEMLMNLSKDKEGQEDQEDHFQLLACKTEDNSPDKAIFQLVKKGEGRDKFKEVKSFNATRVSSVQVTITYRKDEETTETMNSSQWQNWESINNKDLKEDCTVNWQEDIIEHKLSCSSISKTWSLKLWRQ